MIKISDFGSGEDVTIFIECLSQSIHGRVVKCENRSFDELCDRELANERSANCPSEYSQNTALRRLYDIIMAPIADLVNGNELIFSPERSLCLISFAALMDTNSKYLCESFRIRVIPSLTKIDY